MGLFLLACIGCCGPQLNQEPTLRLRDARICLTAFDHLTPDCIYRAGGLYLSALWHVECGERVLLSQSHTLFPVPTGLGCRLKELERIEDWYLALRPVLPAGGGRCLSPCQLDEKELVWCA